MDELHAAIADYLRREWRPPVRGSRMLTCRACGRRVVEGDPGLGLPFDVLWEAACCPRCYRAPLPREGPAIGVGDHPLRGLRAESSVPRCRICGGPIDSDVGGLYNLADMRAVRECHQHYVPF